MINEIDQSVFDVLAVENQQELKSFIHRIKQFKAGKSISDLFQALLIISHHCISLVLSLV